MKAALNTFLSTLQVLVLGYLSFTLLIALINATSFGFALLALAMFIVGMTFICVYHNCYNSVELRALENEEMKLRLIAEGKLAFSPDKETAHQA